jgi:sterol desaturase/sphingolipid hydroxylase (fatty acid hydroxylase superfamily)
MQDWIVTHEPWLRLGAFAGVLLAMLAAEDFWPRRGGPMLRPLRWSANLSVVVVDALLLRLLIPLGATGTAIWAQVHGYGLFNTLDLPFAVAAVLAFLALDLLIYWQHRLFHAIPLFWRLHRMHHSDVEFDTTTGVRFHPVEILASMLIKMGAVLALGAPVVAVIAFEIALNATSLFNHGNLRLPAAVDRVLRKLIVTPDMHRVHHSVHRVEHDSNYGFNLSWWDHLFRSYTAQPRDGHTTMRIGLAQFRADEEQKLLPLLRQPFKKGSDQFSGWAR